MSAEVVAHDEYLPGINVYVERLPLRGGDRFETHAHREHQVVWTASSSILVAVGDRTWVLPPTLALWVPAWVEHATWATRAAAVRGVFVHPQILSPWPEPTVVTVTPVVRELLDLLSDVELVGRPGSGPSPCCSTCCSPCPSTASACRCRSTRVRSRWPATSRSIHSSRWASKAGVGRHRTPR